MYMVKNEQLLLKTVELISPCWMAVCVSKPSPWPSWSSPHRQRPGWRCWADPGVHSASWEWSHPQVPSSHCSDTPKGRRSLSADTQEQHSGVIICLCYDWLSLLRLETSCSHILSSPPPLSKWWMRLIYRNI